MNTLQSLLVSTTAVLLIFGTFAHTHQRFMHNGKVYDDRFYELFTNRAPVKHIIKLAVDWDADKQMDHFTQLYHHIANNDESAQYAQSIVDATRKVLELTLKEVGYQKEMPLEKYLEATLKIQNNQKSEIDPDILEGIQLLDEVPDDTFEKLLNEGAAEELNWELDNLHPYNIVLDPKSQSGPKQKIAYKTAVPEPQTPKESTPTETQPIPEKQEPTQTAAEEHEPVEEIIAEPPKSDVVVPETQAPEKAVSQLPTSEETVLTPQETKEES